jgi:hypothetical protein
MFPITFNSNFDQESIAPITEPLSSQVNGKKQIRYGMTPEEIADIVSDELMEIVNKSLKPIELKEEVKLQNS